MHDEYGFHDAGVEYYDDYEDPPYDPDYNSLYERGFKDGKAAAIAAAPKPEAVVKVGDTVVASERMLRAFVIWRALVRNGCKDVSLVPYSE